MPGRCHRSAAQLAVRPQLRTAQGVLAPFPPLQDGFSYASFELCGYSPESINAGEACPRM